MTDRRRRIVFATAAALMGACALVLTLLASAMRSSPAGHPTRPTSTREIRTGPPPVPALGMESGERGNTESSTQVPLTRGSPGRSTAKEHEAKRAPAVAPRQARAGIGSARRFLAGYLPYSYGRLPADRIRAAAVVLTRELERSPPRVPAAVARANPRLVAVHADATLGERAITVLAVVDDGQRRYTVALQLLETRGHWLVTAIGD